WARRRSGQAQRRFEGELRAAVLARLYADPDMRARIARAGARVAQGEVTVSAALQDVLAAIDDPGRGD
ncbi:MAG: methylmalonyl Co-A mutase-associated GTPase MeaB, partial [Alphaproteobacteria bacterium]|nr:methylmalonyl Co-A mutase-associated GTPase MeaB [Alphaproteobacteria bacterium]